MFSSAYRMVTDCLRFLVHSTDIEILELPIPYPLTSASILVEMVAKAIEIHGDVIKVAVFSHISSMVSSISRKLSFDMIIYQCNQHSSLQWWNLLKS